VFSSDRIKSIKIETIRGKTVPKIRAALNEAYGMDTVDRSTVQKDGISDSGTDV